MDVNCYYIMNGIVQFLFCHIVKDVVPWLVGWLVTHELWPYGWTNQDA